MATPAFHPRHVAVLALLAIGASPARAADVAVQAVDVVAVAASAEHQAAVGNKTVISAAELTRYADTSLTDALRRVPGLTIESGGGGADAVIRLRGLGSGYTQVLLNGDPVPAGFNLASISPAAIERVEILRTPTADLGTQAIAGTINIILKRAVHSASRQFKASAGADGGRPVVSASVQASDKSDAFSWILALAANRDHARGSTTLALDGRDADGTRDLAWLTRQEGREFTMREDLTAEMTWNATHADAISLTTLLRHQHYRSDLDQRTDVALGAPPTYSSGALGYEQAQHFARAKLDWKHTLSDDASLEFDLSGEYASRHADAPFLGYDASGTLINTQSVRGTLSDRPLVANAKYSLSMGEAHNVQVGVGDIEARRHESRVQTEVVAPGRVPQDIDEAYLSVVRRRSAFAQDEWALDKHWSVYWGARWEGLSTDTSGKTITRVANHFDNVSPILQAAWKPWDAADDKLRVSLARTYKPPTTRELTPRRYVAINNGPTSPDTQGNPDLRPELAWGLDLSFDKSFLKNATLSVTAFAKHIDGVIINALSEQDGTWISRPVNAGVATVQGVEAELKLPLPELLPGSPDITLSADVARNWSRVRGVPGPDNTLARQTPFTATLGADWTAHGPWAAGATLAFTGASRSRVGAGEIDRRGNQRTLDVYALWHVDKSTNVRLSVSNALHPMDVSGTSVTDAGGTVDQRSSSPTTTVARLALEMTL